MKLAHILKNEYLDSLMLMDLSLEISGWPGVRQAVIMMGTDSNRRILDQVGLLVGEAARATRQDLIIAADVQAPQTETRFLAQLGERLKKRKPGIQEASNFDSLDMALEKVPLARLVTISVPGEHAVTLARQALEQNRHVFCFSHHVSIEDEIALKKLALSKGLLMMGPDCGTSILDGLGLGFANRVRSGSIGLVSASGSGLQEVTCLIHRAGGGITQAIGVGGRDMGSPVNGLMSEAAIRLLAKDSRTRVIVILAKSASLDAQERVLNAAREEGLPMVVDFLSGEAAKANHKDVMFAETFEECACKALDVVGIHSDQPAPKWDLDLSLENALQELVPGRRALRGLFAGGSLCAEAERILLANKIVPTTNLHQELSFRPSGHLLIDLGAEEFTQGRMHPFIDPRLRELEINQAYKDQTVGVLLLDVVLGFGSHPDPAGMVVEALQKACQQNGKGPLVIASVCGTSGDPQNLERQKEKLAEAGVFLAESNAAAARLASQAVTRLGGQHG